jgi:hypothetical protein
MIMTKQVYQTAQGQSIDLGAIVLKNEHVRAVGNMNVNARGDKIDNDNRIVDERSQQVQRQTERTTIPVNNVADTPVHTSNSHAKRNRELALAQALLDKQNQETNMDIDPVINMDPIVPEPVQDTSVDAEAPAEPHTTVIDDTSGKGGLASAIARSKVVSQEKLKTAKQIAQEKPGVTRI